LNDFLRSEGIYEETTSAAIKETIAWQIGRSMERLRLTKTEMAERMATSRAALDRLLDPTNESVTLGTLLRAAEALGVELHVSLRVPRQR
jgi:antitoxin HicB